MNKLSKEKRNQLILTSLVTLAVIVGLWFTLIRYQKGNLQNLAGEKEKKDKELSLIQDTSKNSKKIEAELAEVNRQLDVREADMASGDLYASMVNSIRKFKQGYNIDIPQFTSEGSAVDVNLLPNFPYKQVTVSIAGTAHYADLGKFVADFENQFPGSRIVNLELSPASAQSPEDTEKLSFKMNLVSLEKPGGTIATPTAKKP
jgi:Tfp pilus assembly protein PilO